MQNNTIPDTSSYWTLILQVFLFTYVCYRLSFYTFCTAHAVSYKKNTQALACNAMLMFTIDKTLIAGEYNLCL